MFIHKSVKRLIFSLKTSKNSCHDGITLNVVKNCFGEVQEPLQYLFNLSLRTELFRDSLKIALVTPLFKASDPKNVEYIMHNRLYKLICLPFKIRVIGDVVQQEVCSSEIEKESSRVVLQKRCSSRFLKIRRKTPVLESLF